MPIFSDPDAFVQAVGPQAKMITTGPFWAQRATCRNGPIACTHVKMSPTTYEVDSRRTGATTYPLPPLEPSLLVAANAGGRVAIWIRAALPPAQPARAPDTDL